MNARYPDRMALLSKVYVCSTNNGSERNQTKDVIKVILQELRGISDFILVTCREDNVFTAVCLSTGGGSLSGGSLSGGSLSRAVSFQGISVLGTSLSTGVFVQGFLSRAVSVQGVSVQGVSIQGVSVQGVSVQGGLCPGQSLSMGSLSRVVSV